MFENYSQLIFVAIAAAIWIGRTIFSARKAKGEPPRAQPAAEPLHFEENAEEKKAKVSRSIHDFLGLPAPEVIPAEPLHFEEEEKSKKGNGGRRGDFSPEQPPFFAAERAKQTARANANAIASAPASDYKTPQTARESALSAARADSAQNFALTLKNLSPLKQAVVMAEVLGAPKGLQ